MRKKKIFLNDQKKKDLEGRLITPQFKDWKNGQYKMISFYAKKARGLMCRFAIQNRITQADVTAFVKGAMQSGNVPGKAAAATIAGRRTALACVPVARPLPSVPLPAMAEGRRRWRDLQGETCRRPNPRRRCHRN